MITFDNKKKSKSLVIIGSEKNITHELKQVEKYGHTIVSSNFIEDFDEINHSIIDCNISEYKIFFIMDKYNSKGIEMCKDIYPFANYFVNCDKVEKYITDVEYFTQNYEDVSYFNNVTVVNESTPFLNAKILFQIKKIVYATEKKKIGTFNPAVYSIENDILEISNRFGAFNSKHNPTDYEMEIRVISENTDLSVLMNKEVTDQCVYANGKLNLEMYPKSDDIRIEVNVFYNGSCFSYRKKNYYSLNNKSFKIEKESEMLNIDTLWKYFNIDVEFYNNVDEFLVFTDNEDNEYKAKLRKNMNTKFYNLDTSTIKCVKYPAGAIFKYSFSDERTYSKEQCAYNKFNNIKKYKNISYYEFTPEKSDKILITFPGMSSFNNILMHMSTMNSLKNHNVKIIALQDSFDVYGSCLTKLANGKNTLKSEILELIREKTFGFTDENICIYGASKGGNIIAEYFEEFKNYNVFCDVPITDYDNCSKIPMLHLTTDKKIWKYRNLTKVFKDFYGTNLSVGFSKTDARANGSINYDQVAYQTVAVSDASHGMAVKLLKYVTFSKIIDYPEEYCELATIVDIEDLSDILAEYNIEIVTKVNGLREEVIIENVVELKVVEKLELGQNYIAYTKDFRRIILK